MTRVASSCKGGVLSISKALNVASVIDFKKTGAQDHIVVLGLGKTVADLQPQFDEIQKCPGRGLHCYRPAPAGSGFDFLVAFFYPKLGDHVCGSAHCALAVYWSKKLGKNDFVAYAASPRGGY
ncbi:putative isomerase BH0283 [Camellia lanceoleosa]|nr:putative isomerase BH0283 [Camellia lanceoleosa]